MSRDLYIRSIGGTSTDPVDDQASRESSLIQSICSRFPQFEVHDLSSIPDDSRLIQGAREIAGLALMECMPSTKPGIAEYELDTVARFVFAEIVPRVNPITRSLRVDPLL